MYPDPALIVGVVGTVRLNSLEEDTSDGMRYYAFAQGTGSIADLVVRTDGNPLLMTSAIKEAVTAVDPSQAVSTVSSLETMVSDSLAGRRLIVWMLGAFAILALLLAMIGIFGLISYLPTQRTHEVGTHTSVPLSQWISSWAAIPVNGRERRSGTGRTDPWVQRPSHP